MPLYKAGLDMWKKYSAKYDPTTIGTRFGQVKDIALDRAQEGLNMIGTIRDLVRPILDKNGIGGGLRGTYLAFGTMLYRHIIRQKWEVASKTAAGLKQYFVTAYGLDPVILDDIIEVVAGAVVPY